MEKLQKASVWEANSSHVTRLHSFNVWYQQEEAQLSDFTLEGGSKPGSVEFFN